jgi:hypothetical protein
MSPSPLPPLPPCLLHSFVDDVLRRTVIGEIKVRAGISVGRTGNRMNPADAVQPERAVLTRLVLPGKASLPLLVNLSSIVPSVVRHFEPRYPVFGHRYAWGVDRMWRRERNQSRTARNLGRPSYDRGGGGHSQRARLLAVYQAFTSSASATQRRRR